MSQGSQNTKEKLEKLLATVQNVSQEAGDSYQTFGVSARIVTQRIRDPQSYVTVIGETSSGKSTILNGFLGRNLLPVNAAPTSGTVTHIYNHRANTEVLLAINRNGTQKELDSHTFKLLSLRPSKDLLRLRVNTYNRQESFSGLNIFDTPGTNSIYKEHEEILQEFIPNSDALIYCVLYRIGFGSEDQSFLELVRDLAADLDDMPVLLVINRVPAGSGLMDKRIQEIVLNANDSLANPVQVFLSPSIILPDGQINTPILPSLPGLWEQVSSVVNTPSHLNGVLLRLKELALSIVEELDGQLQAELGLLTASESDIKRIKEDLVEFHLLEERSNQLLRTSMENIARRLLSLVESASKEVGENLSSEISQSGKWTGADQCCAYVLNHALPFQLKQRCQELEDYLTASLEKMDEELDELANTAVRKISERIKLYSKNDALKNLYSGLAKKLGVELVGKTSKAIAAKVGGRGGIAAGTGNLAKMALKRLGKVFGKKFSRDVYTKIGKFFTKKMMAKASVVFQAAIDIGIFVYDAETWQKKLKKTVIEGLRKWEEDTLDTILNEQLPSTEEATLEQIREVYSSLKVDCENSLGNVNKTMDHERIAWIKHQRTELNNVLNLMENC